MALRILSYESVEHCRLELERPQNPWAELGQIWPKNEAKVAQLGQSSRSKEPKIIDFLLVELVLLCPYLQSGFDSRPGHTNTLDLASRFSRLGSWPPLRAAFCAFFVSATYSRATLLAKGAVGAAPHS